MKRWLMDILCCPVCKGDIALTATEENDEEVLEGTLRCDACSLDFPIHEGIPNLLPPEPVPEEG